MKLPINLALMAVTLSFLSAYKAEAKCKDEIYYCAYHKGSKTTTITPGFLVPCQRNDKGKCSQCESADQIFENHNCGSQVCYAEKIPLTYPPTYNSFYCNTVSTKKP